MPARRAHVAHPVPDGTRAGTVLEVDLEGAEITSGTVRLRLAG